jgi:putative ABC transport system permease protein
MRAPGFTAVAVLTLALGIGANSVIFSLVNTLLLRHVHAQDPEQLVTVYTGISETSMPNFRDFRQFAREGAIFTDVAAYREQEVNYGTGENAVRLLAELVGTNYFDVLGVAPNRGRAFAVNVDDEPGAHPEVIVSDRFWKQHMGRREDAVGSSLLLNGRNFTVIGVLPEGFTGTFAFGVVPEIYLPLSMYPSLVPRPENYTERGATLVRMVARKRPGVSTAQADAAVNAFGKRLKQQFPKDNVPLDQATVFGIDGIDSFRGMSFAPAVFLFLGILTMLVGVVLLIACANLANLLLARAWNRQKEIAVRAALGATRGRLIRQFLTESVLLSAFGGLVACLLAVWITRFASGLKPPVPVPIEFQFVVDWHVLAYTAALALATGIGFGLAPAWFVASPNLALVIKQGVSREGHARRSWSLRNVLVVTQVAACLVLLVCAGLFLRSLSQSRAMDLGFDTDHGITARVQLESAGYDRARGALLVRELSDRIRQIPGVQSASAAAVVPLTMENIGDSFQVEGADNRRVSTLMNIVSDDYFKTLSIPMIAGREFLTTDIATSPKVVVVNQTFARRAWPNQNPIGKQLRDINLTGLGDAREVVGVVADTKYKTAGEDMQPIVYAPLSQWPRNELVLHARVTGDPAAFRGAMKQAILSLAPNMVVDIETMREETALALIPARIAAALLGVLGILGLLLASLGMYGVISYSAAQRTHEMGVRIAVGARPADIFRLIVGHALRLAIVGVAAGVLIAAALSKVLGSLLAGTSALDPLTYGSVVLLLMSVASLAAFVPARRSTRIDPIVALRAD